MKNAEPTQQEAGIFLRMVADPTRGRRLRDAASLTTVVESLAFVRREKRLLLRRLLRLRQKTSSNPRPSAHASTGQLTR